MNSQEKKLIKQYEEFEKKDEKIPFGNRVKTFAELYRRYCQIQFKFMTDDTMNKKEKELLLYELETIKTNMNHQLPDYIYPKKKG